jgi:hypothetical protein
VLPLNVSVQQIMLPGCVFPTAVYVFIGLVLYSAALDMSVLQQLVLLLDLSVLQQLMLPLDLSVLKKAMLPVDVSVQQQPVQFPERASSTAVCTVSGRVCVSVLQQSVLFPEVYGLQQLVLHLDVSVQQQPVLSQEVYGLQLLLLLPDCMSIRACAIPRVSVYKEILCAPGVLFSLCCTYMCPSTKACAAPVLFVLYLDISVPVLHLDVSVYERFCVHLGCLFTRTCAALMCVRLQEL